MYIYIFTIDTSELTFEDYMYDSNGTRILLNNFFTKRIKESYQLKSW